MNILRFIPAWVAILLPVVAIAAPGDHLVTATLQDRPGDGMLSDFVSSGSHSYADSGTKITDKASLGDTFYLRTVRDSGARRLRLNVPTFVNTTCTKGNTFRIEGPGDWYNTLLIGATAIPSKTDIICANGNVTWKVEWGNCVVLTHTGVRTWKLRADVGCTARIDSGSTTLGFTDVPFELDFVE